MPALSSQSFSVRAIIAFAPKIGRLPLAYPLAIGSRSVRSWESSSARSATHA
jgi:hypothetical protein